MTPDGLVGVESDYESEDEFEFYNVVDTKSEGLTPERIKKFATFNADQKTVDEGCAICIDDVEINKSMIRLDCNHFFLQRMHLQVV